MSSFASLPRRAGAHIRHYECRSCELMLNYMDNKTKQTNRVRRHRRVRSKVKGTAARPRLNIFRSNVGLFAQLIDDEAGKTIVSASSKEIKPKKAKDDIEGAKILASFEIGKLLAKKASEKKIGSVVFDRGGYKYHGRVKAVAEGARDGGLKF